jgi:hypothetical protein
MVQALIMILFKVINIMGNGITIHLMEKEKKNF